MANKLTPSEISQLKDNLARLEVKLESSKATGDAVARDIKQAAEDEKVYKKQWDFFNRIIVNYEKELEKLNGTFIANPIREVDLQDHVRSKGRLYQAPKSLEPKNIREMVGKGLSGTIRFERENRLTPEIDDLAVILRTGYGPHSGVNDAEVARDWSPGANAIYADKFLTPNEWYLINNRVFVKVGAGVEITEGECSSGNPAHDTPLKCILADNTNTWDILPSTYKHPIIARLSFPGAEVSLDIGDGIRFFNGFTDLERQSKITDNSLQQGFFNVLNSGMINLIGRWKSLINQQLSIQNQIKDDDSQFDESAITVNQTQITYINSYISDGYPLGDTTPGLNELLTQTGNRITYVNNRIIAVENFKKGYYGDRITLTKARATRQGGTLFRTLFVEELVKKFPVGGDPELKKQIARVKQILADQ